MAPRAVIIVPGLTTPAIMWMGHVTTAALQDTLVVLALPVSGHEVAVSLMAGDK